MLASKGCRSRGSFNMRCLTVTVSGRITRSENNSHGRATLGACKALCLTLSIAAHARCKSKNHAGISLEQLADKEGWRCLLTLGVEIGREPRLQLAAIRALERNDQT